jgi:hypothetical protein
MYALLIKLLSNNTYIDKLCLTYSSYLYAPSSFRWSSFFRFSHQTAISVSVLSIRATLSDYLKQLCSTSLTIFGQEWK